MELNNIRIPSGKTLTYNGSLQKGVDEGEGYTLTSHQAMNAGTYTAIATLTDPENTKWIDQTVEPKKITYKINKLSVTVPPNRTYAYTGSTINYSETSSYYTLSGQTSGKYPGTYTAKANLIDTNNTQWSDGTISEKTVTWYIDTQITPDPGGGGSGGSGSTNDTTPPSLSCSASLTSVKPGIYYVGVNATLSDSGSGLRAGTYGLNIIVGPNVWSDSITVNTDGTTSASGGAGRNVTSGTYNVQVSLTSNVSDVAGNILKSSTTVSGGTITVP